MNMNYQPDLNVVHGSSPHNPGVLREVTQALQQAQIKGTFYIGYPVMASSDSSLTVDALLISQKAGFVAFHFFKQGQDYKEYQDRLYYILEANLKRHDSLRSGRELGVKINVISIFPEGDAPATDEKYPVATTKTLAQALEGTRGVSDDTLYKKLSAAIQRVTTIKPTKKRVNVVKHDSKGWIIRTIEKEIANLDPWQKAAAIEAPEGPQRIRGLAGSGKTVVLALKAAYLHTQHPDWKIAVTFHTRALYQQFKDMIERFTLEHMGDKPDWEKLNIVHSWGSSFSEQGIYSIACNAINLLPTNYLTAKSRYGAVLAFGGVCDELAAVLKGKQLELYDAVLIDEAQDLPTSFFRIVDAITKQPKRIIWAYDELQNLSETVMASPQELFDREITLTNAENAPRQDIILPVCYRNTPWALTLAHALGFGLFRKPEIVQHFDEPRMWEEIGYTINNGTLDAGQQVTLERAPGSYPNFFKELLSSADAITSHKFESRERQYAWIAEEIKKNIEQDELDPDDIIVVLLNPITQKSEYFELRRHLDSYGIISNLAGITNDRDIFLQPGAVTVSGIYRAKGNEAPMVYIANTEYCAIGHELIRLRNILFTGITRSRAWVRLCGVGEEMDILQKEIDQVVNNQFKLKFTIPTGIQLEEIRRINRDRSEQEKGQIKHAEKSIKEIVELLRKGVISPDAMPELQTLIREMQKHGGE